MPKWKSEKLAVKKTPLFPKVFFSLFCLLLLLISGYFLQPLKLWQQYQDYQKLTLAKDLVNASARFYKIFGFFPWGQDNSQFQSGVETALGDYYYNSQNESDNFYWLLNLVNQGILSTSKAKKIIKLKAFYVIKSVNLKQVEVCFAPISVKYQAQIGHWCGEKEAKSALTAASDFHQFAKCADETPLNIFANEDQLICFNQTWE